MVTFLHFKSWCAVPFKYVQKKIQVFLTAIWLSLGKVWVILEGRAFSETGHQEFCNEVRSLSPPERLVAFEPGTSDSNCNTLTN